jgi:magnesium-transporting ATPase (P-type)
MVVLEPVPLWNWIHIPVAVLYLFLMDSLGRRMNTDSKKFFVFFLFCMAAWTLSIFMIYVIPFEVSLPFLAVEFLTGAMTASFFALTCYSLTRKLEIKDYLIGFSPVFFNFPALLDLVTIEAPFGVKVGYTPFLWVFVATIAFNGAYGIYSLFSARKHIVNRNTLARLDTFLAGMLLALVASVIGLIIVEMFVIPQFAAVFAGIGVVVAYRSFREV